MMRDNLAQRSDRPDGLIREYARSTTRRESPIT